LDQDVEDFALIIDGTSEVDLLARNRDDDLVEVPSSGRRRAHGSKATCVDGTETSHRPADRLVRDGDPALSEQVSRIPKAEGEAQIQPDGVLMIAGGNP
jgi:hypothetical protein